MMGFDGFDGRHWRLFFGEIHLRWEWDCHWPGSARVKGWILLKIEVRLVHYYCTTTRMFGLSGPVFNESILSLKLLSEKPPARNRKEKSIKIETHLIFACNLNAIFGVWPKWQLHIWGLRQQIANQTATGNFPSDQTITGCIRWFPCNGRRNEWILSNHRRNTQCPCGQYRFIDACRCGAFVPALKHRERKKCC